MVRTILVSVPTKASATCLASLILLTCLAVPPAGSWWDWHVQMEAYWGAVGGAPTDITSGLGVSPFTTDGFDVGGDSQKPDPMPGPTVYVWFNRPDWGRGPIAHDFRSPIAEGTSKRWGTAIYDTWNVKASVDNGPSGYFHPDCDPLQALEYPIAASIYITWEFGAAPQSPPEDYTFTLVYCGGINPKPAGTRQPDAMEPPAVGTTWDMETTPYIVLPLWSVSFQPWLSDCSRLGAPDTAKFFIVVKNPADVLPLCSIEIDPSGPQAAPATFTFTASACCDQPFGFSWDFDDGAGGGGSPIAHTYGGAGDYVVTCTVTDAGGGVGICQVIVNVPKAGPIYVDCNSTCPDPDGREECPYRTIQEGIDAAADGDTVVVLPGTYYEGIEFRGKAITVTSTDPGDPSIVAGTLIDGGHAGNVVAFINNEGPGSVLRGFTARNSAAGIYCHMSSPTIMSNVVTRNSTGITCQFSSATIINNTVVENGHGVICVHSSPSIINCTIAGNWAGSGAGIGSGASSPMVCNCIVWNDVYVSGTGSINMTYCDVWTDGPDPWPGEGNICADPQFADPENGNYHLLPTSPCIDAGTETCVPPVPRDDTDGDPRPWPTGGAVDIGADEWVANPVRFTLRGGCWHLITIPCQPLNPDPWEVFDELREPNQQRDLLSGSLYRYDSAAGEYVMYQRSVPAEFGDITPGQGYWLWLYDDEIICYHVARLGVSEPVHLPDAGWHMVGSPQPAHAGLDDTAWYHGTSGPGGFSTVTQPGDPLWLQDSLYYWSSVAGGYASCGLQPEQDDHLRAFRGYWLYTFVDDVTMEVPPP